MPKIIRRVKCRIQLSNFLSNSQAFKTILLRLHSENSTDKDTALRNKPNMHDKCRKAVSSFVELHYMLTMLAHTVTIAFLRKLIPWIIPTKKKTLRKTHDVCSMLFEYISFILHFWKEKLSVFQEQLTISFWNVFIGWGEANMTLVWRIIIFIWSSIFFFFDLISFAWPTSFNRFQFQIDREKKILYQSISAVFLRAIHTVNISDVGFYSL